MKERILTKEEQILVLETKIKERALIIYVIESNLTGVNWAKNYKSALKDEIQNHSLVIEEYKEQLKQLLKH